MACYPNVAVSGLNQPGFYQQPAPVPIYNPYPPPMGVPGTWQYQFVPHQVPLQQVQPGQPQHHVQAPVQAGRRRSMPAKEVRITTRRFPPWVEERVTDYNLLRIKSSDGHVYQVRY